MAWRCSGRSNQELIQNLLNASIIKHQSVYDAMLATDRALYTRSLSPYDDAPQGIAHSSATISAPHMHAHSLSQLSPFLQAGSKVLDVGCGSGYLVACFSRLVGARGLVVGIDHVSYLTELSTRQVKSDPGLADRLDTGGIKIVTGDGRYGVPAFGPYDAIHVGAAASVMPESLIDQLKAPGRLYIPVCDEGGDQHMWIVDKDKTGKVTRTKTFGVRYVPLTDAA